MATAAKDVVAAQRRTAKCKTCGGWGFSNPRKSHLLGGSPFSGTMEICECQPEPGMIVTHVGTVPSRTDGRGLPQGAKVAPDRRIQLPSEKRAATRRANAAAKTEEKRGGFGGRG